MPITKTRKSNGGSFQGTGPQITELDASGEIGNPQWMDLLSQKIAAQVSEHLVALASGKYPNTGTAESPIPQMEQDAKNQKPTNEIRQSQAYGYLNIPTSKAENADALNKSPLFSRMAKHGQMIAGGTGTELDYDFALDFFRSTGSADPETDALLAIDEIDRKRRGL